MSIKIDDSFPLKLNFYKEEYLTKSLQISSEKINFFISHQNKFVREFERIKKDGISKRIIQYPIGDYKLLLKRLNKLLMKRSNFDKSVVGGLRKKNLIDMVGKHCGKEAVFQIDLENFFPNITSERVFSLFRKSNCSDEITRKLTQLVTYQNKIPQGFPTSTIIANIAAYKLDFVQVKICKEVNITRTRWIDDIVFSGRISDLQKIVPSIKTSVKYNGFIINEKKTKFQFRKNNKIMSVGLEINTPKPRLPNRMVEEIKDYLSALSKYGKEYAYDLYENYFGIQKNDPLKSILGKIKFINIYNPKDAKDLTDIYRKLVC